MKTAVVLLSDRNQGYDPTQFGAVCTVSKDLGRAGWDHGGFDTIADYLHQFGTPQGFLWCDRPYVVGNPGVDRFKQAMTQPLRAGAVIQILNEPDLPDEQFAGTPADFWAFQNGVTSGVNDGTFLHGPISGNGDLATWVDTTWTGPYAVHAYGNAGQIIDRIQWYLDHTTGDLYITELNFGAGQQVNVAAWQAAYLQTVLDFCAKQPRIKMVAWFAWKWSASGGLPTSVDAADYPDLVKALASYTPPEVYVPPEPAPTEIPRQKFALQYRQGNDIPESSFAEVAAYVRRCGGSIVSPKALDGNAFLGDASQISNHDTDPVLALHSVAEVVKQQQAYAELGLGYLPWACPRGFNVEQEAQAHAAVANAVGGIIEDFEWLYAGFWGQTGKDEAIFPSHDLAWKAAVTFFKRLRELTPGKQIILQPDPRQVYNRAFNLEDLFGTYDAVAPQQYWPMFREDWHQAYNLTQPVNWGAPLTWTIYSSDPTNAADVQGTDDFLNYIESDGITDPNLPIIIFQRQGMTDALADVLAVHGGPGRVFIAPPDDPNGNGGRRIWTDDRGHFRVLGFPSSPAPAPAPPPVTPPTPAPVPLPQAVVQTPAAYETACGLIYQGIEEVRRLARLPGPSDFANADQVAADDISRLMDGIKSRRGL